MRHGHVGLQIIQADCELPVVNRIRVGAQLGPVLLPALGSQKFQGFAVAWEDGGGDSRLRAHVGDGSPLGHLQIGQGVAAVLDNGPHITLGGDPPKHLQGHVLGRNPRPQPPGQVHPGDARIGNVQGLAAHGKGHVQSPNAEGRHSHAAAGYGVAVAADQGLSGL